MKQFLLHLEPLTLTLQLALLDKLDFHTMFYDGRSEEKGGKEPVHIADLSCQVCG